ncbi:MAG: hypothetical protein AB1333_03485 [Patescibacteria group bacterium]
MRLIDMITPLELDSVNERITEVNFPIQPEDLVETEKETRDFYFGKDMNSNAVIARMNEKGFRPATTREQLKWAPRGWDGKSIVVALGQSWSRSNDNRLISVLHSSNGERMLDPAWFDTIWGTYEHFLGVRK